MNEAEIVQALPSEMPLLPRRASEERPLFVILTAMAFLAGLTLLIFLIGMRASQSWQNELSRTVTVQILHDGSQNVESLSGKAKAIVKQVFPNSQVGIMDAQEARGLLSPWIGDLELPADIPLPIVIKVDRKTKGLAGIAGLQQAMVDAGLNADIDDHSVWSQNIRRTWRAVQTSMAAIIFIVMAASAAVAAYATQSVLRTRQTVIDVLAHVGAPDRFIAGLFVRRFLGLSLAAALTGAVAAFLFLVLFAAATKSYAVDILPVTGLRLPDFIALTVLILTMGLICAVIAGWTTLTKLRRDRRRG